MTEKSNNIPSIKRRIQKHTGVRPKDQDDEAVDILPNLNQTYDLIVSFLKAWRKCQKFETVSSRCKTREDFLNMLPTMLGELESHNKKFKFVESEPELTPELVSQIWDD